MLIIATMCGICGYIGGEAEAYGRQLQDLLDHLRHRGPDGRGTLLRARVALGQTRLCILGDAEAGRQPVSDERYSLVFNGEIHNYLELAAGLQQVDPHGRAPTSDTEVLFALLSARGASCLAELRGFWAFAFVDHEAGTVLLSRDRFGQKPLLYVRSATGVRFASEASALGLPLRVELNQVRACVSEAQYPAAPATFFEGVYQVMPGASLTIDIHTLELTSDLYYDPRPRKTATPVLAKAAGRFRELLRDSLSLRLRADRTVGLMLSAGKDSGTLAALIAARHEMPAFTYSNRASDDEASEVEAWYGARFKLKIAQAPESAAQFFTRARSIHRRLDAPMLSASLLALDALYATASAVGVPVVLSGQGADELLGGYHYYAGLQDSRAHSLVARIRTLGGVKAAIEAYRDIRANRSLLALLGLSKASSEPLNAPMAVPTPPLDRVTERRLADLSGQQLQSMLWYEDRIAMAHGVEARYPFLDVALVDYCLGLPGSFFVHRFSRKRLLQEAFGLEWPAELRREVTKRGLPAAEAKLIAGFPEWFREGATAYVENIEAGDDKFLRKVLARFGGNPGPREARTLFRVAAAGWWLRESSAGGEVI